MKAARAAGLLAADADRVVEQLGVGIAAGDDEPYRIGSCGAIGKVVLDESPAGAGPGLGTPQAAGRVVGVESGCAPAGGRPSRAILAELGERKMLKDPKLLPSPSGSRPMDSWFVPKEIRERHGWSAGSELMSEDFGDDSPVGLRRTGDPAGGPDRLYRVSGPDQDSEEESLVGVLKSGRERRPAIAIDLGGTVEDTWQSKRRWFAAKGFDLGPWPRSRKEVIQIIGGRAALYEQMVSDVYNDTNILSREPVDGVASALKALATQFTIIIVSSRSSRQRATTLEWLKRHHLCIFVSDMALIGEDTNKLAWCLRAGVLFLIDDDPRHLEPGDTIPTLTRVHFSGRPIDALRMRERIVVAGTWQDIVTIVTARQIARTSIPAGIRADQ